jgi:hypothetical protein
MSRNFLARFVSLNKVKVREQRLAQLRRRDGEDCRRCRRPLRFDLPHGHDMAPRIEEIAPAAAPEAIDHLVLCHGRCNGDAGDMTGAIRERLRSEREAALFGKSRQRA